MGTAKVKQEDEADSRIIAREKYEILRKKRGDGKNLKQDLTIAKDQIIELLDGPESPYYRSD